MLNEQIKLTDNLTKDNFPSFVSRFTQSLEYLYEESSVTQPTKQVKTVSTIIPPKIEEVVTPYNWRKEVAWVTQAAPAVIFR